MQQDFAMIVCTILVEAVYRPYLVVELSTLNQYLLNKSSASLPYVNSKFGVISYTFSFYFFILTFEYPLTNSMTSIYNDCLYNVICMKFIVKLRHKKASFALNIFLIFWNSVYNFGY